jgi:hypothetical protein
MRSWKLPDGTVLPIEDPYMTGLYGTPTGHELAARQWLQEYRPDLARELEAIFNTEEGEDTRATTIAFMERHGWKRIAQ